MPETELVKLIRELLEKSDQQHRQNLESQQRDRESFNRAMREQRDAFQVALNKQYEQHIELDGKVNIMNERLIQCIGEGQPGEGRLGEAEKTIEMLVKFKWQAVAVITTLLLLAEHIDKILKR